MKSQVSIVKGEDVEKMVEEALDLLGGVTSLIKPSSVVVIKPNAGHAFGPETAVCTNPVVVGAIVKEVKKANPKEIIIGESAATGWDTLECLDVSGIGKAAMDAGADKLVDFKREQDLVKVHIRDPRSAVTSVLLPRFLIEADYIINVPIFKSHVSMVFTCALKNWKGVVQDKIHYQMHQTNLAAAMMDLWSVFRSDLNIADLVRPAEGFGPHTSLPVDFGCIAASKDPVALDATVCRMVGLPIDKVAYFEPATERGLGVVDEDLIEIRGRTIKEVFKKLWLPYLGGFEQWPEYRILADGACSSCQAVLAYTMEKLKALGHYDKNKDVTIVVGRTKEVPNVDPHKLILIGDCVKKFRDKGVWCEGCPPGEPFPMWCITDRESHDSIEGVGTDSIPRMAKETPIFMDYIRKKKAASGTV